MSSLPPPRLLLSCTLVAGLLAGTSLAVAGTLPGGRLGSAPVGRQADRSVILSTGQRLTPAGVQLEFPGRPTAIALNPDGRTATLLSSKGDELQVIDLATRNVLQSYGGSGGSFDGIAYNHAGTRLFTSEAGGTVTDLAVAPDGTLKLLNTIASPGVAATAATDINSSPNNAYPGGLAFSADDSKVYVVYSVLNQLAVIDVATNTVGARIDVGNAPHSVVIDGSTAWVSDEGGRRAGPTDFTNDSDGTAIVADPVHGAASTGVVSVVDLVAGKQVAQVSVGLHPTAMTLAGRTLYVANTNSDSVSVIDTLTRAVRSTIAVQPYAKAPYGSHVNGLAVLTDGRLAVTLGRSNAVALFVPPARARPARYLGLLPTGWYPSAVAQDRVRQQLIVVNGKGVGNLGPKSTAGDGKGGATGSAMVGSVSFIPVPGAEQLSKGLAQVAANNGWATTALPPARQGVDPKAIPERLGEPSTIKHVIYIVKENRTYDQVLGDDPRGNGDPALTQFGAAVTPNEHLLSRQFPLVDNFYDCGQLSADGHQWAVQGDSPDYLEKAFGGFTRSYPAQGHDALTYLPDSFLWENALKHGKTVRDYGEYATYDGTMTTETDVPSLKPLLNAKYPGFDTTVPDAARAAIFDADLAGWVKDGAMPNLVLMTLPNDHTVSYLPTYPSVDSMVFDNDASLGQVVQAVSRSPFWKDTAILVQEDDSQNGLDHVDAHRSIFFAISPYAKHGGYVEHTNYNQVDALRTAEQMLGLPAMNQMDAAATPMSSLFTDTPDLTPYTPAVSTFVPSLNPPLSSLTGIPLAWARISTQMDFSRVDAIDDRLLNHAIWYAGHHFSTPYPGESRVLLPAEVSAGPVNRMVFDLK